MRHQNYDPSNYICPECGKTHLYYDADTDTYMCPAVGLGWKKEDLEKDLDFDKIFKEVANQTGFSDDAVSKYQEEFNNSSLHQKNMSTKEYTNNMVEFIKNQGGNVEITEDLFGYNMTDTQAKKLMNTLEEDILDRYHNEEYWDSDIIETFMLENNLKEVKEN